MARVKVLVLGGGVGAMTAAYELTATPALRERFEVVVVQPGHRLGGKGASGRDLSRGGRIEEHGLHLWFGFYDTAFRIMRDCYDALGRPAGAPLARWDEAFVPFDSIVLYDRQPGGWRDFRATWPANGGTPGDGHTLPGFWEIAELALGGVLQWWRHLTGDDAAPPASGWKGWLEEAFHDVQGWLTHTGQAVSDDLLEAALAMVRTVRAGRAPTAPERLLVTALDGFRDAVWSAWERRADDDAAIRVFLTCLDTCAATLRGLVEDRVVAPDGSFDRINDVELCAWLRRHGARELTIGRTPHERAPILRALYDVAFGYRDGDIARADIAAGAAVNDLLRLVFTYRGHIAYKMQAGMGDTVFAPLYEVLRDRGVRFAFFTAATRLGVAADADLVDEVDVVEQASLRPGRDAYDPLVDVRGLPCWPSQPDWDQLAESARGADFEAQRNPLGAPVRTLRRGADFDEVVLGVSVGGLDGMVDALRARSPRFDAAMATAVTVRTQAFQLWTGSTPEELGWAHGRRSVAGCYVEPLDTYCDMTHLLPREDNGADVRGLGYFCGVLDHRDETSEEALGRVRRHMEAYLREDLVGLWPASRAEDRSRGFALEHLAGRLEHQYWRANVGGTELYVLSCAGTIDDRLPSADTGFANLVAAGDWTRNGIDGGCVEAAAVSGVQAAAAVLARHMPMPHPVGPADPLEPVFPGPALPAPPVGSDPRWLNA